MDLDLSNLAPAHHKAINDALNKQQHESMLPTVDGYSRYGTTASSTDLNNMLKMVGSSGMIPTGTDIGVFVYQDDHNGALAGGAFTFTHKLGN